MLPITVKTWNKAITWKGDLGQDKSWRLRDRQIQCSSWLVNHSDQHPRWWHSLKLEVYIYILTSLHVFVQWPCEIVPEAGTTTTNPSQRSAAPKPRERALVTHSWPTLNNTCLRLLSASFWYLRSSIAQHGANEHRCILVFWMGETRVLTVHLDGANIVTVDCQEKVCSVAFHPDGGHIVGGGWEGKLWCWGEEVGQEVGEVMEVG